MESCSFLLRWFILLGVVAVLSGGNSQISCYTGAQIGGTVREAFQSKICRGNGPQMCFCARARDEEAYGAFGCMPVPVSWTISGLKCEETNEFDINDNYIQRKVPGRACFCTSNNCCTEEAVKNAKNVKSNGNLLQSLRPIPIIIGLISFMKFVEF